jgi:hypothetical protein
MSLNIDKPPTVDNIKSFAVSYFENSNQVYQEALAGRNYFQAAIIKSNMHCDIAESTVGLVAGGMGPHKVAFKVGALAMAQGSRALLWSAKHSSALPGKTVAPVQRCNVYGGKNELIFSQQTKYDFAPKGYLDGELYPPHKLRQLYEYLHKRDADMKPPPMDAIGVGFRAMDPGTGKPTVYLWPNSTVLQVKHELSHYLDCKRLGAERYSLLSTFEKEQMVLDRLRNKKKFWENLNGEERLFSEKYVSNIKDKSKIRNNMRGPNVE